jgi:hypothetical protein
LVIDRILNLLLGKAPVSSIGYARDARRLLRPLAYSKHGQDTDNYLRSIRCLEFCFHLLEGPSTEGDQARFQHVAAALRLSFLYTAVVEEDEVWSFLSRSKHDESSLYWGGPPDWHTQAQFDLLVDYLVQVGQGTDYTTICDAFAALAGLRGLPSTLERRRLYIQTITRFMESEVPLRTRHAAMSAAYALRTEVAAMDRDDEPLRYLFSRALSSVVRARDTAIQHGDTSVDDNPFNELSILNWDRNFCYLGLLCVLSKESTWHSHLHRHGHFKSCLSIIHTLSSQHPEDLYAGSLAVYLTQMLAIVDALTEDHEFLKAVQTYRIWPLVLLAWRYMFSFTFFNDPTAENWEDLSSRGIVESLRSVAAYSMKHREQWVDRPEALRLIQLVDLICDKLDEEKRRNEQDVALAELGQENDTFGHQMIPNLSTEISKLLDVLWKDMSR